MPLPDAKPFGFILVTADPPLQTGRQGRAWDLVRARLAMARWPIYERTRSRGAMRSGMPLAFYVGGTGPNSGFIVATAIIEKVVPSGRVRRPLDPPEYFTQPPSVTLVLKDVRPVTNGIEFRAVLPLLSFKPTNLKNWGMVLHGGSRALTEQDWRTVFGTSPAPDRAQSAAPVD